MKDNVVSKVGQLVYRFQACYGVRPTHVLLGEFQIAELKGMLRHMHGTELQETTRSAGELLGMQILCMADADYCCVGLMGHMGHEE